MEFSDDLNTSIYYATFDELPPFAPEMGQQELISDLEAKISSKNWLDNVQALNILRQINKSFPQSMNQVCEMLWNPILHALENAKTAVCKTTLLLFQEIFVQVNSGLHDVIIQTAATNIILKTQHTNIVIRTEAQKAYELLTSYCVKESLIVAVCVSCADKNPKVAELAFKALEKVLESVYQYIVYVQVNTFKALFTAVKEGLTGKRMELKKHADVILKGIYQVLGDEKFSQLIQFLTSEGVLEDKDIENMKQSFEIETEEKQPRIGEVLSRRRKMANAEIPEL